MNLHQMSALFTTFFLGLQIFSDAQEEPIAKKSVSSIPGALEEKIPEVTFSSATLEEAVEFLRFRSSQSDQHPEINFLIRPGAKDRVIEELTLRDSTILDVLNAAEGQTRETGFTPLPVNVSLVK